MRRLSDVLLEFMQRKVSAPSPPGSSFSTGTIIETRSGGPFLVQTTRGCFWMDVVTDEPIRVGQEVWVGFTDGESFVAGLKKT